MFCVKCNNELAVCTCEDIDERLAGLSDAIVYRKCLICGRHYARCKCENPVWGTSGQMRGGVDNSVRVVVG